MPRFNAPADTGGVLLSSGLYFVRDGAVEVPGDLPAADLLGLAANGFTLAPAIAEAKAKRPSAPEAEAE